MTYKLDITINHKSFAQPMVKELYFSGHSFEEILAQIDTLPQHLYNLRKHQRAAFKDINGVKHSWKLKLIPELN